MLTAAAPTVEPKAEPKGEPKEESTAKAGKKGRCGFKDHLPSGSNVPLSCFADENVAAKRFGV